MRPPKPKRRKRRKAASRRPPLRPLHVHVIDIQALKGPDGTLDGDVRALLAATGPRVYTPDVQDVLKPSERTAAEKWNATEWVNFEHRRVRLTQMLSEIDKEPDRGPKERRALVKALWPSVRKLLDHRSDMAVMATARAEERRARWTDPAQAIPWLEELRARYFHFDPISEPLELVIRGFTQLQRLPRSQWTAHRPIDGPLRLAKAGNAQAKKLPVGARQAIENFVHEDDNTKLRRLVGFLPLFDRSGRSLA